MNTGHAVLGLRNLQCTQPLDDDAKQLDNSNRANRIVPYGRPPWPRFVTTNAEANSLLVHCACPAGMGRKGGAYILV